MPEGNKYKCIIDEIKTVNKIVKKRSFEMKTICL